VTDRGVVASTIEFGGQLSESAIFDLLAAAEEDEAVLGGRQAEYDEEFLRLAVAPGVPLRFTRAQAAAEEFVELEAFCRARRLAYRRFGDGGPSGEPGILFWAPGREEAQRAPADARGRVYLTLAELGASAPGWSRRWSSARSGRLGRPLRPWHAACGAGGSAAGDAFPPRARLGDAAGTPQRS
jgi:hypothetical protein